MKNKNIVAQGVPESEANNSDLNATRLYIKGGTYQRLSEENESLKERVKDLEEIFSLSMKGCYHGERWEYLKQKLGL